VARALAAMHAAPGRKWTVANLAEVSGFSRSVFAERFRKLTGTTPLEHLTGLRMLRARVRLREGAPVKSIADELGYRTSFAFAQAFKRRLGCPPSRYQDPPQ
jgi:AraC-like DNA-binding protein